MDRLNEILHELGISKVKLAKFLGVSRQMIYNYLELDDINKWPKDKKVLLLNLLDIKSPEEIDNIKVNTDYILNVEAKLNSLVETNTIANVDTKDLFNGLDKERKDLLDNIISIMKEDLDDDTSGTELIKYKYLLNYLQAMETAPELKYILAYMAKTTGFVKPLEFAFNEEEQFIFESILFSAMTLYNSGGKSMISKSKLIESHKRFVNQIEHKMEEKLSRTMELNSLRDQALKELNYSKLNDENASEVFAKIAEIQSRKIS
ncbi:MAG: hypothetical protein IJ715_00835 [Bacilli bacterium]|nr:hypothetical protein [Bacilli bacterium]